MNHIKKLLEYTNYADDMVNKLPKDLTEIEEPRDIITRLKPRLQHIMLALSNSSFEGDDEAYNDILNSLTEDELETIQDTTNRIMNSITNRLKQLVNQN